VSHDWGRRSPIALPRLRLDERALRRRTAEQFDDCACPHGNFSLVSNSECRSVSLSSRSRIESTFLTQRRVVIAIMLRMLQTRFFGHGLGFLVSIAWPLVHIGILLLINTFVERAPPYGTSLTVFYSTGLVQFMTFSYMSRWIMVMCVHCRPLMMIPIVKITDLLFAGILLEALSACCMVIFLVLVLSGFGINCWPDDLPRAATAFGAAMLLGAGCGVINGIMAMAFPIWVTVYNLTVIFLYFISGIFVLTESIPQPLRGYLMLNPVLQATEWMRAAYYPGYGTTTLSEPYVVAFGAISLALGLVVERLIRGRLLIST
jgi:capsular polysaccharide transport system permease protein